MVKEQNYVYINSIVIRGAFNQEQETCHISKSNTDNFMKQIAFERSMNWDFKKHFNCCQQCKAVQPALIIWGWLGLPLPSWEICDISETNEWNCFIFYQIRPNNHMSLIAKFQISRPHVTFFIKLFVLTMQNCQNLIFEKSGLFL